MIKYDDEDLIILERALRDMKPHHKLFKLIKAEMKRRGHWKNLKRGKPNLNISNK